MYQIREVTIKNKLETMERKTLVIEFNDPNMAIVSEFLMTDAPLIDFDILNDIEKVLTRKGDIEIVSGNRCSVKIEVDKTTINDLLEDMYDDFTAYSSYEISTTELKDLIIMWQRKLKQFQNKNH